MCIRDRYRNYIVSNGESKLDYVASCKLSDSPKETASEIAKTISFDVNARATHATWEAALSDMISCVDSAGVLVMRNGVVGSNNKRSLDVSEFSGFAIADEFAPLVFVNGKDSRSRQMFTLAHELAHIWLGETGLSLNTMNKPLHRRTEQWCDKVAAELLMPLQELKAQAPDLEDIENDSRRIARHFKVSTLVVLRRLLDGNYLGADEFHVRFNAELKRVLALAKQNSGGGDYYRTQISRTGKQFTRAVVSSALEGQTLYRDAFAMLGVKKQATFNELARNVGVML